MIYKEGDRRLYHRVYTQGLMGRRGIESARPIHGEGFKDAFRSFGRFVLNSAKSLAPGVIKTVAPHLIHEGSSVLANKLKANSPVASALVTNLGADVAKKLQEQAPRDMNTSQQVASDIIKKGSTALMSKYKSKAG